MCPVCIANAMLVAAGATWVIVPGRAGSRDDSVAFLERFGSQIAQHTGATS